MDPGRTASGRGIQESPSPVRTLNTLPIWTFFAPNPGRHDYWVVYRTLDATERTSPWRDIELFAPRRFHQLLWFRDRRIGKAVFDLAQETLLIQRYGQEKLEQSSGFELLDNFVRRHILAHQEASTLQGYQFAVTRAAGYDESEPPEILYSSSYRPLHPAAETSARD